MNSAIIRIAIPCYDGRVFPRFDGATEFCICEANLNNGTYTSIESSTCPPQEDVCNWLARKDIHGVICSGIQRHYQVRLDRLGIWLCWGISGKVTEALSQWISQHIIPVATGDNA